MKTKSSKKRALSDLRDPVAKGVLHTVRLLQESYGASDYHDSGHAKAPVWIFKLPRYGNAEVGVRMNKRDTTLYMRDRTCDGKRLRDLIPASKVARVYPRDGNPVNSVLHSAYLGPSASNEVLMLELELDDVEAVLAAFFGKASENSGVSAAAGERPGTDKTVAGNGIRAGLTEEDFASLLERRSETGRAGEMLVILDEMARLRACGCPRPEDYVKRVAESDVGCGYDVASTWPGEERCIEVKTTTRAGSDFFLTANERAVLGELGERAWIYRVEADGNYDGKIVARLNNPMRKIAEAQMIPVVWRVPNCVFDGEG